MRQREHPGAYPENNSSNTEPHRFVTFLSKVSHKDYNGHHSKIVSTRYGSTFRAGQVKASFQCRRDDIDEAIACHTLSKYKNAEKQ